jgi:hypothetical protein
MTLRWAFPACLLLATLVRAQNPGSSYGAPAASSGYAAPAADYGAPTGGASYAAAAPSYDAPAPAYDYAPAAASYDPPSSGFGDLDLSSLSYLIPLFLIVLLAIIVAAFIAPFIAQLAVIGVGILPMALSIKAPIVNAILLPFGLTLCNRGPPVTAFTGVTTTGRELADSFGLSLSEDQLSVITDLASAAFDTVKSKQLLIHFKFHIKLLA